MSLINVHFVMFHVICCFIFMLCRYFCAMLFWLCYVSTVKSLQKPFALLNFTFAALNQIIKLYTKDPLFQDLNSIGSLVILRVLRLFRVLRIFKLSRHSKNMIAFGIALRSSLAELLSLGLFLSIDVVVFARWVKCRLLFWYIMAFYRLFRSRNFLNWWTNNFSTL